MARTAGRPRMLTAPNQFFFFNATAEAAMKTARLPGLEIYDTPPKKISRTANYGRGWTRDLDENEPEAPTARTIPEKTSAK